MTKGAEGRIAERLRAVRAELEELCQIRFLAQLLPHEHRRYEQLCAEERRLLVFDQTIAVVDDAPMEAPIDLTDVPAFARAHRAVRPLTPNRRVGVKPCWPKA